MSEGFLINPLLWLELDLCINLLFDIYVYNYFSLPYYIFLIVIPLFLFIHLFYFLLIYLCIPIQKSFYSLPETIYVGDVVAY